MQSNVRITCAMASGMSINESSPFSFKKLYLHQILLVTWGTVNRRVVKNRTAMHGSGESRKKHLCAGHFLTKPQITNSSRKNMDHDGELFRKPAFSYSQRKRCKYSAPCSCGNFSDTSAKGDIELQSRRGSIYCQFNTKVMSPLFPDINLNLFPLDFKKLDTSPYLH
jgi:hypothetical protein